MTTTTKEVNRINLAVEGFSNAEQFVTIAHAARNTHVPFILLKHRVLTEHRSLADAIRASKPDLNAEVEASRFRQDLYFRLNTIEIHLPPLRDRREDIPLLAKHFLRQHAQRYRKALTGFDPSAMQLLMRYDDGFVAYLNGQEIARKNAPTQPRFNSLATAARTNSEAIQPESFLVPRLDGVLQAGVNVLAIHGLNRFSSDPDLLVLPELRSVQVSYQTNAPRYFATPTPGAFRYSQYQVSWSTGE